MIRNAGPRIVLTTGGTGGHIFPALAAAEEIRRQCPEAELLFVGSCFGPEARLAEQAGVPFAGLAVRGVLGRGLRALPALARMGRAVFEARKLLKAFGPHAAAGFGGYASFAPLAAARWLDVPVVLHEQNAVPGAVNRFCGRFAQRVLLSLPDRSGAFDSARCLLTGNPVRKAVIEAGRRRPAVRSGSKRLLVMGGSQGARAINSVILASLDRLAAAGVQIRHQTGAADLDRVLAGYRAHGRAVDGVAAFIENMAEAYAEADLVLCRAGASSTAELAAAGRPSVLIPFPHATHDHQRYNALALVEAGAAIMVEEKACPSTDVAGLILGLLNNPSELDRMAAAASACAAPDAAADAARAILATAGCGTFAAVRHHEAAETAAFATH